MCDISVLGAWNTFLPRSPETLREIRKEVCRVASVRNFSQKILSFEFSKLTPIGCWQKRAANVDLGRRVRFAPTAAIKP